MPMTADQIQVQTATPINLGAIFVSLELSKATGLVTALSPGSEKMSRHTITGGDTAGLFSCFAALRQKATRRKDKLYPLVVIQEAGLDGFWLGRVLSKEPWIESHIVEAASIAIPRRHRRAKTDRIDGETLIRALMAWERGEPRACSMVKLLTPEEDDNRRIGRERKILVAERAETNLRGPTLASSRTRRDAALINAFAWRTFLSRVRLLEIPYVLEA